MKINILVITGIVIVSYLFLSCITLTIAGPPTPYALGGHVSMDNNSIVGANIKLTNLRTGAVINVISTNNGEYVTDAYNFAGHYENGDNIKIEASYSGRIVSETIVIDTSKGMTLKDIKISSNLPVTSSTPSPTPYYRSSGSGGGGGGGSLYSDTDGDGLTDIEEKVQGSDPKDPCSPNFNSVACTGKISKTSSTVIKEPIVTTPITTPKLATIIPTTPKPKQLNQQASTPQGTEIDNGILILCIGIAGAVLLGIVLFIKLGKRGKKSGPRQEWQQ